jgi:histone H3/H4
MAKKAAKAEPLVVGTKVRALIKAKGAKMSGELLDALNCCVACCVEKAIERAQANKRTTVKPQDL